MPKIDVTKVAELLKKHQVEPTKLRAVIEEINLLTQPDPGEEEKPPAMKKQFVILLSDPEGKLPKEDLIGWVLQLPENESPATARDRIFRAAYDHNASKKGRKLPVGSIGEALESVNANFFKEVDVWVKTKLPVQALRTDNELPKEA